MNLFLDYQVKILLLLKKLKKKNIINLPSNLRTIVVELPPKDQDAIMSCNAAMILAKANQKTPSEIAEILKKYFLNNFNEFEKVDFAKPGFLNIFFRNDFWKIYLRDIIKQGPAYGANKISKKKYNIEFVSANPTGPLHVGHCRGAIIGDAISNLLKFNGNVITKEYYVNDYGSQIKNFVFSVYCRILEITENKIFPNNLNLYPGIYIVGIAKKILKNKTIKNFSNYEKIYNKLAKESLGIAVEIIKNDLSALGIKHDNFVHESKLIKNALVQKTINKLEKQNFVYRGKLLAPKGELTKDWVDRQQLLFKSTNFTDDIDRPLTKADQSWTYFASDIAYHANKIDRKFNVLINILGADHTGYIKRISAAVLALSNNKINLICKVTQLVKLLRKGEPFKMSKRKGDYITAKDLVDEVGKDSVRFIMLNRSNEAELDFDFDKVTEKSKENPVFYVQYAYARINSIFRSLHLDIEKKINFNKEHLTINKYEIEILKKVLEWPKCVTISSTKLEPHRIPVYLYDLVTLFHAYWNMGKIKEEYRFIINNKINNKSRLALLKALSIVIKNGMSILGVSTPKRM